MNDFINKSSSTSQIISLGEIPRDGCTVQSVKVLKLLLHYKKFPKELVIFYLSADSIGDCQFHHTDSTLNVTI